MQGLSAQLRLYDHGNWRSGKWFEFSLLPTLDSHAGQALSIVDPFHI